MSVDPRSKKTVAVLVAAGAVAALFFLRSEIAALLPGNGNPKNIEATGTVEIDSVNVSAEVSGKILFLGFDESETVAEGDLLAELDRPDLTAQAESAQAAVARAEALLADLKRGARPEEIARASSVQNAARARYDQAQRDMDRYAKLYDERVISKKELEQFSLALDIARSDYDRAAEALLELKAGARADQVTAQEAEVKRLKAVERAARDLADKTEIRSPADGFVLTRNYEPGELAPQGGVLYSIGHYQHCYVRIFVPSTLLGMVSPGRAAEARVDSFPDEVFTGRVSEISQEAEFTPRQSITPDERANLVFRVEVDLDNPEGLLKPGMPADVTLR
ncbi:MAG: efflux RND transporter periplasmic adaptor subunit [Synergistota bacterium]|nr:efflux RND transporter periplasmic adaptor subunit [Synergistota bacterium]